jgi:hypothetical protein
MFVVRTYTSTRILLNVLCVLYTAGLTATPVHKTSFHHQHDFTVIKNGHVSSDTNALKQALKTFMEKADSGKYDEIVPYYDSGFLSIRVVDAGQVIRMDYQQMLYFWKMLAGRKISSGVNTGGIVTQKTTVHYIEISGSTGYILMTRIKDLGHGPEPMFYNLIWINKAGKWYLLREIVHQKTLPDFH